MVFISNDEVAISLPFSLDGSGNIISTNNQDKIWGDRVRAVIGTVLGERVMRPDFGTRVAFSSFETQSGAEDIIRLEIERAFILQLPLLNYVNAEFNFNAAESLVMCNLLYELPNRKQATTRVGVVVVSENNPAYEETA